ncbi:MAG: hypothetical protein M1816_005465 [Peltula sp. TS41687]|nr:MAG: hypothetical protein M1816_005465 [Peltula sp. TS41687]
MHPVSQPHSRGGSGPSITTASPSVSASAVVNSQASDDIVVDVCDADLYSLSILGSGSFASVYDFRGSAFKVVHDPGKNSLLRKEYEHLEALQAYRLASVKCPLYFRLPTVQAYYDPRSDEVLYDELRYRSRRPPALFESSSASSEKNRLKSTFTLFRRLCAGQAIYWMQCLPPVPYDIAKEIRSLCYPEPFRTQPAPTICRLYFGRDKTKPTGRFFNQKNFPLDRERYRELQGMNFLPRAQLVVQAMGEALGRIHWQGLNDARDVEFVLAGDPSDGTEPLSWVIDFNQTSSPATPNATWAPHEISQALVRSFFANDPYYPRPRAGEPLYGQFKSGYYDGAGHRNRDRATLFLYAIEEEQRMQDHKGGSD